MHGILCVYSMNFIMSSGFYPFQITLEFGSSLLSTPNFILVPNHPPPPRTSIVSGIPPFSLTLLPLPVGTYIEVAQNGRKDSRKDSTPMATLKESVGPSEHDYGTSFPEIAHPVPWQCFEFSSFNRGLFTPTVDMSSPADLMVPLIDVGEARSRGSKGHFSSRSLNSLFSYDTGCRGRSLQFFRNTLSKLSRRTCHSHRDEDRATLLFQRKRRRPPTSSLSSVHRNPVESPSLIDQSSLHHSKWASTSKQPSCNELLVYYMMERRRRSRSTARWFELPRSDSEASSCDESSESRHSFVSKAASRRRSMDGPAMRGHPKVFSLQSSPTHHSSNRFIFSSLVDPPDRAILFSPAFFSNFHSMCTSELTSGCNHGQTSPGYHTPKSVESTESSYQSLAPLFPYMIPPSSVPGYLSIVPLATLPETSLFEILRQSPSAASLSHLDDRLPLPWILSTGGLISLPKSSKGTVVRTTNLWTIYKNQVPSPLSSLLMSMSDSKWTGLSGFVDGCIGRSGNLSVLLGPPTSNLDDLLSDAKNQQHSSSLVVEGDTQPSIAPSSILLAKVKNQSTNAEIDGGGFQTDSVTVADIYRRGLEQISVPSLTAAAVALLTGSRPNPDKEMFSKSIELVELWKKELFSAAAERVASDQLVMLELRRLASLLENYGQTMRRRAEANNRSVPVYQKHSEPDGITAGGIQCSVLFFSHFHHIKRYAAFRINISRCSQSIGVNSL